MDKPKILVILGQTATGKSDLAVKIAKDFNGEIISADSRQVYKGLNIGSGKITKKEMSGIKHHLLDIISPKSTYTVKRFKHDAEKVISEILKKNKLPIICGGTGYYIQSIVDGIEYPEFKQDTDLVKKLEAKSNEWLLKELKKLDSERAKEIDVNNKRRLIRAIEIAKALGKVPPAKVNPKYEVLQIGLEFDNEVLKKRIYDRLIKRMRNGMIAEAKKLHADGLSWKRMESLGLEYKYLAMFLQNKISKEEMLEKLNIDIWHFAKRQKTWFKRDGRIKWFEPKEYAEIKKEVKGFL